LAYSFHSRSFRSGSKVQSSRFNRLLKNYRSPFENLRANGAAVEMVEHFPFVADPSTGSGLKAVEGACPEAPRRVEALSGFSTACQQLHASSPPPT
jgi:hypothetical protein